MNEADPGTLRPRLVGLNHIALEVGDVDEALVFYGRIFDFKLRGRGEGMAFVDMGDQFLALMQGPVRAEAGQRHFGLVVNDRSEVRALAEAAGARFLEGSRLDFLDPWGNRVEVVEYASVQFTKTEMVLQQMHLELQKDEKTRLELEAKGKSEQD